MNTYIKHILSRNMRPILITFVFALLLSGCGPSAYTAFKSDPLLAGKTFSPRDRPAEISAKRESSVLAAGYMLIGTVVVQQEDGGSYDADPTTQARGEAAKNGGDLVILKRNNERTSETRYKTGGCERWEMRSRWVYDYVNECDSSGNNCHQMPNGGHAEYDNVCVQYEKIPYTVYFTSTEAKVFRRDPDLIRQMSGFILIGAIQSGQTKRALELIAGGADLTAKGKQGETALTEAAAKGDVAVVKRLVQAKLDVNAPGKGGGTALALAAENGHTAVVRQLISAGADLKGDRGSDALLSAALAGHADVARLLRDHGVRLDRSEASATLRGAAKNGNAETVRLLLDMGADVNARTGGGYTALMGAAENGHASVVKLLLAKGADVKVKNKDNGYTALFYAIQSGKTEVVRLLIAAGADVNARAGAYGKSVLQTAADKDDIEIIKILRAAGSRH
jgi:ankyrin repeat protein